MEILKSGKLPKPKQENWVGGHVKCKNCGVEFKLEASDRVMPPALLGQPSTIKCPTEGCGASIEVPVYRAS